MTGLVRRMKRGRLGFLGIVLLILLVLVLAHALVMGPNHGEQAACASCVVALMAGIAIAVIRKAESIGWVAAHRAMTPIRPVIVRAGPLPSTAFDSSVLRL